MIDHSCALISFSTSIIKIIFSFPMSLINELPYMLGFSSFITIFFPVTISHCFHFWRFLSNLDICYIKCSNLSFKNCLVYSCSLILHIYLRISWSSSMTIICINFNWNCVEFLHYFVGEFTPLHYWFFLSLHIMQFI